MQFAVYGRYSCDRQNPTSADDQVKAILDDVARRSPDWTFSGRRFKDEAKSATTVTGRDGFNEMVALVESGSAPFDAILIEDVARAFRNVEDAAIYRGRLRRRGVAILSKADGYVDPDSEAGLWIGGIKAIKAEADSLEIGRRTLRGLLAKAERGFWLGGPIPFGYRRKPIFDPQLKDRDGNPVRLGVKLAVEPHEAEAVRTIFRLYVQRDLGFKRIAEHLNHPDSEFADLKPNGFAHTSVRGVLTNEVYMGRVTYNRRKFGRSGRVGKSGRETRVYRYKGQDELVRCDNAHEAIVDGSFWQQAQAKMRERGRMIVKRGAGGTRARQYLLSGLIRCGQCGARFIGRSSGRNSRGYPKNGGETRYRHYACGRRASRGRSACPNASSVPAGILEGWVLKTVDEAVLSPAALEFLEAERRKAIEELLQGTQKATARKKAELARIEREIGNLVLALKAGVLTDAISEEAEKLEQRKQSLLSELSAVDTLTQLQRERVDLYLAENRIRDTRSILRGGDVGEVRAELAKHIESIAIYPGRRVVMVTRNFSLFGDQALEKIALAGDNIEEATSEERSRMSMVAGAGFEPATSGL